MKKLIFILLAALLVFGGLRLFGGGSGGRVTVMIEGNEQGSYPLAQDLELDISTQHGTNHLSIKGGVASVTEADCPDRLCVHQAEISYEGEMIVSLPHKLILKISGGEEASLDGVVP